MNPIKTKLEALKEGGVTVLAENAVWLASELEDALSVIEFYADILSWTYLKGEQANENPWGRPVIKFDDLSADDAWEEWGTYGGKRAREFLERER